MLLNVSIEIRVIRRIERRRITIWRAVIVHPSNFIRKGCDLPLEVVVPFDFLDVGVIIRIDIYG